MIGRLASNCNDPSIKFKLQQYISREGKDLFTALLLKQVTFIHILHAFPAWIYQSYRKCHQETSSSLLSGIYRILKVPMKLRGLKGSWTCVG